MRALRLRPRVELFGPAAASGLLAALLVWLGPPGTDLAAHAYQRALFLQHGFVLWNNFWYGGRYSFVNYSVLYYPLAAGIGIKLLAVLTVTIAVVAFSAVVRHEWELQSRWTIWTFALVWALLVVSAAYPFMLGMALALLALWSLQQNRRWVFAGFTLLTLAASPLAFLLLVVLLAGVALAGRGEPRRFVAPAAAIAAIGALELLMRRMFPGRGSFPFSPEEFLAASTFCLLGVGLTWKVAAARMLRWTYVVYFVACTAAFAISSPVGENIARLRFIAAPVAILTLSLRRWQPRSLCVVALALALSWNLTPLAASFAHGVNDPAAHRGVLVADDQLPPTSPPSVVPRRGGGHGRTLARRLPCPGAHPARARLVPPGGLPAEPRALRRVRGQGIRRLAAAGQRPLRRPHLGKSGLQLACRGASAGKRALGAESRLQDGDDDDLRGLLSAPADHRAGPCPRARVLRRSSSTCPNQAGTGST